MNKKIISLPTNDNKLYLQFLAFMSFTLDLSPQERSVVAEIIKSDNEYDMLPPDKRGKFILSTDMRIEMREKLDINEAQFNVILSKVKKKTLFGQPLFDDNNCIHDYLKIKPDKEGFRLEVNFVNTIIPTTPASTKKEEKEEVEEVPEKERTYSDVPIEDGKYVNGEIIEEPDFNISLSPPND
jgi:hypothetical protein